MIYSSHSLISLRTFLFRLKSRNELAGTHKSKPRHLISTKNCVWFLNVRPKEAINEMNGKEKKKEENKMKSTATDKRQQAFMITNSNELLISSLLFHYFCSFSHSIVSNSERKAKRKPKEKKLLSGKVHVTSLISSARRCAFQGICVCVCVRAMRRSHFKFGRSLTGEGFRRSLWINRTTFNEYLISFCH